jgi:hypothetical protein
MEHKANRSRSPAAYFGLLELAWLERESRLISAVGKLLKISQRMPPQLAPLKENR